MIDSYGFGVMVINGRRYTSDVIVFPEKVIMAGGEGRGIKSVLKT